MSTNFGVRTGTIKFFDQRGWGYLIPSDGSRDLWFHCSALSGKRGERSIADGTHVTFRTEERDGRLNAVEVRPILVEVEDEPTSENEVGTHVRNN